MVHTVLVHLLAYFTAYQKQWNGRQIIRWKAGNYITGHWPVAKTLVILYK